MVKIVVAIVGEFWYNNVVYGLTLGQRVIDLEYYSIVWFVSEDDGTLM